MTVTFKVTVTFLFLYCQSRLRRGLTAGIETAIRIDVMREVFHPCAACVIAEQLNVCHEQVRVLGGEVMRVAEEHLKITRHEFPIILKDVRMPNWNRLGEISVLARQVAGQFEALALEEETPRFGREDVAVADS